MTAPAAHPLSLEELLHDVSRDLVIADALLQHMLNGALLDSASGTTADLLSGILERVEHSKTSLRVMFDRLPVVVLNVSVQDGRDGTGGAQ